MRNTMVVVGLLAALVVPCGAQTLLTGFEDISKWQKTGECEFAASTDAHEGAASIQVTLPGQVSGRIVEGYGPEEWDEAAGVSFWAKGDGSDQWGCIALYGDGSNGSYRYCYFFPLKSTEWQRYEVTWADWIPEGPFEPIGMPGALPPSGIQWLRIGTRWSIAHNNAPIPKHTYWVDEVRLEAALPEVAGAPGPAPLSGVISKLRQKQPVSILCMGDSITAGTSLPDKDAQRYATVLQAELRKRLGYDEVTVVSRAVGGARLTDARSWVRRDFQGPAPDLVTTLYGYNDKSGLFSAMQFAESLEDYLSRVCAITAGKTAIVPIATIPGAGPRFVMMDDYAKAVEDVADSWQLDCIDLAGALKEKGRDGLLPLMADMAHPNAEGHLFMAQTIADFLMERVHEGQ